MADKAATLQKLEETKAIVNELEENYTYPLPFMTGLRNLIIIFLFSTTMIIFGIITLNHNSTIVEYLIDYPTACNTNGAICTVDLKITKTMTKPVFLYYGLTQTFQSHRRWIMSTSFTQLYGKDNNEVTLCEPVQKSPDGKNYVPCGLRGYSFFNDAISITGASSTTSVAPDKWITEGIALPTDKNNKKLALGADNTADFKKAGDLTRDDFTLPNILSDAYLIWMRPATTSKFYKLYAKIDQTLEADQTIQFSITNNYPAQDYGGKKSLFLTTSSVMGGKNNVLIGCLLAFGGLGNLGIVCILLTHCFSKKIKVKDIIKKEL